MGQAANLLQLKVIQLQNYTCGVLGFMGWQVWVGWGLNSHCVASYHLPTDVKIKHFKKTIKEFKKNAKIC